MTNFYTEKLQHITSPDLVKDLNFLEPVTRAAVQAIIEDAAAEGITLHVTETFRAPARQQTLFAEGKTQLKDVGVHRMGLACDFCKIVAGVGSWDGDWSFLSRLALKHGLISGYDWGHPERNHKWRDPDHVQRVAVVDQPKLLAGTWYPDEGYRPA